METSHDEANRVPDPELTELGRQQAEALASWLERQDLRPQRLFSSLMRRAIETAAPIGSVLDLPVEARPDLYESGGMFAGAYNDRVADAGSPAEVLRGLATRVELPDGVDDTGWYRADVETAQQACQRATAVADWLRELDEECVAIVIHAAFASLLLAALVHPVVVAAMADNPDADTSDLPLWFRLDNSSVSNVEITHDAVEIDWINRIDHLAAVDHQISRTNDRFPPRFVTSPAA